MAIVSGYQKMKDYIKQSSGYKLISRWANANTLECDDGKTLQSKVGGISGISSSLTANSTTQAASTNLTNQLYQNIENKVSVGGDARFHGIFIGEDGTDAYVYGDNALSSDNQNIYFRYRSNGEVSYTKCKSRGATPSAKTPTAIASAIDKIYTDRYNAGLSASTLSKCEVLATSSNQDQMSLSHTTSKAYKLIICCVGAGDQGKSLNGGHATASCSGFNVAVSKQFDDVQIGSTKVAFGSHVFYLFNVPSGKKINLNWSYRGIGTIIGFN